MVLEEEILSSLLLLTEIQNVNNGHINTTLFYKDQRGFRDEDLVCVGNMTMKNCLTSAFSRGIGKTHGNK